jgi:Domain of unknown function (DUF4157)
MTQRADKQNQPQPRSLDIRRSNGELLRLNNSFGLQRSIGNRAVQSLFQVNDQGFEAPTDGAALTRLTHPVSHRPVSSPRVNLQAKLTVNAPGDMYEQEADRVAEQVMRTSDSQVQRKCTCEGSKCSKCENQKVDQQVQTKRIEGDFSGKMIAPPAVNEVLHSSGQPLDSSTRAFMESRFGHDFGPVRVHTSQEANNAAAAISARAFTTGYHIVFGAGTYAPLTASGRGLIAHELAHTLQQTGSAVAGSERPTGKPATVGRQTSQPANTTEQSESPVEGRGQSSVPQLIQRAPDPEKTGPAAPSASAGAGGLDVEFNAFIPGSLGNSFDSFPYPKDLGNQTSFEAALKGVKGTWLKEPGSFSGNNTGAWHFATDNRGFGGGSHRLGFAGRIVRAVIGSLAKAADIFNHTTSGSEHVRWKHTGIFTSKGETGSIDGPYSKSATPKSKESHEDTAADESTVTTKCAANYPFAALSPDIDYKVTFNLKREASGKLRLRFEITKNKFPFYELLIGGKTVWNYSASDPGPTLTNLSSSDTVKSGDLFF